jgi:hypothetical protein
MDSPHLDLFNELTQMSEALIASMHTCELTFSLGVRRNTLGYMLRQSLLCAGIHRRKINPLTPRGEFSAIKKQF